MTPATQTCVTLLAYLRDNVLVNNDQAVADINSAIAAVSAEDAASE